MKPPLDHFAGLLIRAVLIAMAVPVSAQFVDETPQPFGLELAFDVPEQALPPPEPAPDLAGLAEFNATQQQIAVLEAEQGPYNPELAGPLTEAAQQARALGLTDTAAELYAWALHNTRVNQGLSTDTQIPLVETLLEMHRAAGDLDAMNDREAYLYRLNGSGRPPLDETKLSAAVRYLDWRLGWLQEEDWRGRGRASLNLYEDVRALTDDVCADPDYADGWCAAFAQRQLAVLYGIDYYINTPDGDELQLNTRTVRTPDLLLADERLINLERTAYRTGVRALELALEQVPDNEELQLALADWRWFQGRRAAARKVYKALVGSRPEWFQEPVALPAIPAIAKDPAVMDEPYSVTATLRVTASGRVRDVELADASSLPDGVRIRATRALRDLSFRPALDASGEAIEAKLTLSLLSMR